MTPKRDPARRNNMKIKAFRDNWLGNLDPHGVRGQVFDLEKDPAIS